MYTLSPTFWSWWHGLGLRCFVLAYVDAAGQAVGFFGQHGGELIVQMHSIRRVLIGFAPAKSCYIYYTYIWHSGNKSPMAVRGIGSPPHYSSFVRHLVRELEHLQPVPRIELGATLLNSFGGIFTYGIFFILMILMALNELLEDDMYSLLGIGPWGSAVFAAIGIALGIAAWRHYRRWYRPRLYSQSQLEIFLPNG